VVVAVGLTLVEPVAEVEVNAPGIIPILVAPTTAQLSELLVPEFTPAGLAAKEVIVGGEPLPGDEVDVPQSTSPAQVSRTRASTQIWSPGELNLRTLPLFLRNE
jgi:hypothetical protein